MNPTVSDVPVAVIEKDGKGYSKGYSMLPLPPAKSAVARTERGAGMTLSGTVDEITLNQNSRSYKLVTANVPVVYRWRTAGDNHGVTVVGGQYPYDDKIPVNSSAYLVRPAGANSIVLDIVISDTDMTFIEI